MNLQVISTRVLLITATLSSLLTTYLLLQWTEKSSKDSQLFALQNDIEGVRHLKAKTIMVELEETVHFPLEAETAHEEWLTTNFVPGSGTVRSTIDQQPYMIPMAHQLHCLRYMRNILSGDTESATPNWKHIHHCFNFLRQWILCEGDTTLEMGDFTTRNFTEERVGVMHTCRDWMNITSAVQDDWNAWTARF